MNIVIVGGGFAGVKAALELAKRKFNKITLISDNSYFLHHATLYATATGRNLAESVVPLEQIFASYPNVKIVQDTIISVEHDRREIVGKKAEYKYGTLILAMGMVTTFFGIPGLKQRAFGIKTLDEVKEFQNHISDEVVGQKLDKEYFVIGGGSTGVELAGALREYIDSLISLYRLKGVRAKVTLVEAGPRILPRMSKTASKKVSQQLKKMGIKIILNKPVESLESSKINIDGKEYPTTMAVWTSGVANNPFFKKNDDLFELNKAGRVVVNEYLEAAPGVFVIGDSNDVKHSGMAWPALKQATFVAKHLTRKRERRRALTYRSFSVPTGIPVGEKWGYVEWLGIYAAGWLGYKIRRLMELYGYCQLVPFKAALPLWRAHNLPHVD